MELAPRIQMPPRILPHTALPHKNFRRATALHDLLAIVLDFCNVRRVQDRDVPEHLLFGFREAQADEFATAARERLGRGEHRGAILPRRVAVIDRDYAVRQELLEAAR